MSRAVPRFRRVNAPLPPPGAKAVIEIAVVGIVEGQRTVNTFYYAGAPAALLTSTDLLSAINAWTAAFLTDYKACLSSDWAALGLTATCLTQPTLQTVSAVAAGGVVGTGPASHAPNQVAVVISRYTATKGQHGRGRVYMPAVPDPWLTASSITGAAGIAAYTAFAADIGTGITVSGIAYAASVVQRAATSPRGIVGVGPITFTLPRYLTGTCRRRRLGRGK